jgi:hypothetical protein
MFIVMPHRENQAPSGAACAGLIVESGHLPLLTELEKSVVGGRSYRHGAPQQPAKGAALVGESPTRRIRRFTTEQPDACRCRKARGEKQSRHRTDGPK